MNITVPQIQTWIIVALGGCALMFGAMLAHILVTTLGLYPPNTVRKTTVRFSTPLLITALISSSLAIAAIILSIDSGGVGFFNSLKQTTLTESATGQKKLVYLVYVLVFYVLLVLYYVNTVGFRRNSSSFLIYLSGIIASLMSGSRGLVVFLLVATIPCLVGKKHETHLRTASLVKWLAVLVLFFFSYPIIFQGMTVTDIESWLALMDYAAVYGFSGVSAFDDYLITHAPEYDCLLLIPRPILGLIDFVTSSSLLESCPVTFDVKYIPSQTNVYSAFFAPYHDAGLLGIELYWSIVGFLAQITYLKGCVANLDNWRFAYCMLYFSLCLSFFEDQFSRGFIYYVFGLTVFLANLVCVRLFRTQGVSNLVPNRNFG